MHKFLNSASHRSDLEISLITSDVDDRRLSLRRLLSNDVKIAVTTNMLSRSIDVPNISLVINFDAPTSRGTIDTKIYQYRAGRTARFGNQIGAVLTFVNKNNMCEFKRALKYELKVKVNQI